MKILWAKPILPFPPNQGTKRVTLQLLQNLSAEHELILFTRLLESSETAFVRELERAVPGLRVEARRAPNRKSPIHRAAYRLWTRYRGLRGVPPVESYTAPPELVRGFRELAAREHPDLVVAEYWYSRRYLEGLAAPSILFAHDIEYQVRDLAGGLSREAGRAGRWGKLEVRREREALLQARHLWVLTERDRESAFALGCEPGHVDVVPYGVDTDGAFRARTPEDPAPQPRSVVLFGAFQADFNRDALNYTLEAVLPELRRREPQTVLRVAGGGLDEGLRRRCRGAGVEVMGEVASVRRTLLESAVVLIPLRYGGGLRIRLLEALALECPVVGTPAGVLGMGAREEEDLLVGNTPEALAGQIVRLFREPELGRALGEHGRKTVTARHGLEAGATIQRELVGRHRPPAGTVDMPGPGG